LVLVRGGGTGTGAGAVTFRGEKGDRMRSAVVTACLAQSDGSAGQGDTLAREGDRVPQKVTHRRTRVTVSRPRVTDRGFLPWTVLHLLHPGARIAGETAQEGGPAARTAAGTKRAHAAMAQRETPRSSSEAIAQKDKRSSSVAVAQKETR